MPGNTIVFDRLVPNSYVINSTFSYVVLVLSFEPISILLLTVRMFPQVAPNLENLHDPDFIVFRIPEGLLLDALLMTTLIARLSAIASKLNHGKGPRHFTVRCKERNPT